MSTLAVIGIAIGGVLAVPIIAVAVLLVAAIPLTITAMFDVEDDNGKESNV